MGKTTAQLAGLKIGDFLQDVLGLLGNPTEIENYGSMHYPVEGFNVQGADTIRIEFMSPEDFDLDISMFKEPGISRAYCANVIIDALNIPFNVFFHAVREVDGVIEYRSRYWIGYTVKSGCPVRPKLPIPYKMKDLARNNCLHSLTKYNNLASFLPQLYKEMDGKI